MSAVASVSSEAAPTVLDDASLVGAKNGENMVWVNTELTNTEISDTNPHIVEIAVIVTDKNLNVLAEGPSLVIHQTEEVLAGLSNWCKANFPKSGLLERIRASKVSMREAEDQILAFLDKWVLKGKAPLCGNTIHKDKRFIDSDMPRFAEYLHFRLIDVSTINGLGWRWFRTELRAKPKKKKSQRALDDIRESIAELRYYRRTIFKAEVEPIVRLKRPLSVMKSSETAETSAAAE